MIAKDVVTVMKRLRESGIDSWLDGGWGVDALLGEETRRHEDLDLVVELAKVPGVEEALKELGYLLIADERPTRVILTAEGGRQIDLHTVVFDGEGGGTQRLPEGRSYRYPPEGFRAVGRVVDEVLPCLTPEVQLECHTGYEPTEADRADVTRLVERFGLSRPKAYQ